MKPRIIILIAALAGIFTLPACDEDILDVNQTLTYEWETQVVSATDTIYAINEVIDLAAQNDVIEQYGDKIKQIEITDVTYWLTAFNGDNDQTIIEATLKVADENGGGEQSIATIQNQVLQELLNNPKDLTVNQSGVDLMQNLIKNSPHTFRLAFNTACNKAPLNFTVKFKFTIDMTANPL